MSPRAGRFGLVLFVKCSIQCRGGQCTPDFVGVILAAAKIKGVTLALVNRMTFCGVDLPSEPP